MTYFPIETVFFLFLLICLLVIIISNPKGTKKPKEDVRTQAEIYAWKKWAYNNQDSERYQVPSNPTAVMSADYEAEFGVNVPKLLASSL